MLVLEVFLDQIHLWLAACQKCATKAFEIPVVVFQILGSRDSFAWARE